MTSSTKPLISIILPVYNVRPYIEEAVDSVLRQTYENLEIILVDDGSTDGSADVCNQYGKEDARVKVIHQKNMGLSAARNAGLDICKGELIAFLDPDDLLCEDAIYSMYEKMVESGADIVVSNHDLYIRKFTLNGSQSYKRVKNNRRFAIASGVYSKPDLFRMRINNIIPTSAWGKLYRRNLWDDLRYPVGQNYEEIDIIIPLLMRTESIFILDKPFIIYRKRPGSITDTCSIKNVMDKALAYKHYINHIRSLIPEYLDDQDLVNACKTILTSLLGEYIRHSLYIVPDRKRYFACYREAIDDMASEVAAGERGFKIRVALFMVFHLPPLAVGLIYRIYRPFRVLELKVTGRS